MHSERQVSLLVAVVLIDHVETCQIFDIWYVERLISRLKHAPDHANGKRSKVGYQYETSNMHDISMLLASDL